MINQSPNLSITKRLTHLLFSGFALTLLVIQSSLAQAGTHPDEFSITDANQFVTTSDMRPSSASGSDDATLILAYNIDNEIVRLELSENTRLMEKLPTRSFTEKVKLYSGKIVGNDESWARITKINGALSGAIFDGEELFLVDSSQETFQAMAADTQSKLDRTQPVIFRAKDVHGVLSCGVADSPTVALPSYQSLVKELNTALSTHTIKEFSIDIHTDSQYDNRTSGSVESNVMSQMNIVDGIFSGQLDIQFNITSLETVSGLDTNDSGRLLDQYYNYTASSHPGLAHLFTGKYLDGGSTLGIAYVDAVCRSWGVGVSQAGGRGVAGALTVAHELGHNLGSPHDNQGGPCDHIGSGYLMNPYANNSDEFSSCSIEQINQTVDTVSCYVEKDAGDGGDGGDGGDNNNPVDVLTPSKNLYLVNEDIQISYNKNSSNSLDWVGIYKTGDLGASCSFDNDTYIDWRYAPNTSGSVILSGMPAGNYQVQMFSNDGYCFIGEPKSIMVGSFDYAIMAMAGLLLFRRRQNK